MIRRLIFCLSLCSVQAGCVDPPKYLTVRTELAVEPGQAQYIQVHTRGSTLTVGFRAAVPVKVYVVKLDSKAGATAARQKVGDGKVPEDCVNLTKKPEKTGHLMHNVTEAQFYGVFVAAEQRATVELTVSNRLSSEPEAKLPD